MMDVLAGQASVNRKSVDDKFDRVERLIASLAESITA